MNDREKAITDQTFYYVNPNSPSDPKADVFCANTQCVNFIPVHQTCNLKTILISSKGVCEFSVQKKVTKLKAHEKQPRQNKTK